PSPSAVGSPSAALDALARERRAPRRFMISIVALYSSTRRARSARCSFFNFSRSAPTAAGDAGGAAVLRAARTASFGRFACASALASSRVTGPALGAAVLIAFLARALAGDALLVFLRFTPRAMCSPSLRLGTIRQSCLSTAMFQSARRAAYNRRQNHRT